MSTQSTSGAAHHDHGHDEQHAYSETPSDQLMTDPSTHAHNGRRPTASSTSVSRPPRKTAPPSAPLPPLPKGAMSPRKDPAASGNVPSSNEGKSFENEKRSVPSPVSQPKPMSPTRAQTQAAQNLELKSRAPPVPPAPRQDQVVDPVPPAPPPKSGLLKRLTTRLAGSRSSPSLRPPVGISEEGSRSHRLETPSSPNEQREHEEPSREAVPVPARPVPPIPEEDSPRPPAKPHPSMHGRLSLAALAEKRAEKREARAREEQRATDARRAAALAKTGLLPASRRYSIVQAANEHGYLRTPPFDPFAKDRIRRDDGSDDGIIVEEGTPGREESQRAGGLSAAEAVIREWRERNADGNEMDDSSTRAGAAENTRDEGNNTEEAPSATDCAPQSSHSASAASSNVDVSKRQEMCLPSPMDQLPTSPSAASPPLPPKKSRTTKEARKNEETGRDEKASESAKGEKAALGKWRFPTTSPGPSDSASTHNACDEKMVDEFPSPASPESNSSGSTAVAASNKTSRPDDALMTSSSPRQNETSDEQNAKYGADTSKESPPRSILSPAQIPLPASPGPVAPKPLSTRNRALTTPPTPIQRLGSQKPSKGRSGTSQALAVSLPALSPTTSTSTTTSGGSTLPRTPSTSSHGHSPVRVLDTPLEREEDAISSNTRTVLASITESKPEVKVTGVREFGQLAKLADLESETSCSGALPPLPPKPSQGSPSGCTLSPATEDDRRKRTTLFGRRRTTHNDPPMIAVPESYSSAGTCLGANAPSKPRHVSSFTNLRRTVTSVATGLTSAAGTSSRSRDRSPLRGSSMPTPRLPASPSSNTSGADSLTPTGSSLLIPNRCSPGVGLRPRPLNPTMHSRGSILMEAHAIEDAESRRLAELAFLD